MQELDSTLLQAMGAEETFMARETCDVSELSRLRYQTARVISARRRIIDALYNQARGRGGSRADAAREVRAGDLDVRMRYSEHVSEWPITRVVEEMDEYRRACARLGEAIRQQLAAERAALYPDRTYVSEGNH